jgi:hypothetical protein
MPSLPDVIQAAKELGIGKLTLYAIYQAKIHSGWYRFANPGFQWEQKPLDHWVNPAFPTNPSDYLHFRNEIEQAHPFFFAPDADLRSDLLRFSENLNQTLTEANEILGGTFRYFGGPALEVGFPPAWNAAPGADGGALPLDRHWSLPPGKEVLDIKLVWEPSRFSWVFPLARAYRITGDGRYAIAFWTLVSSWREYNQPYTGPNWSSAQEVALRLLTTVFGWYAFAPYLRKQPERCVILAEMLAIFAHRIPFTLEYARSQGNNHLLSEACALYTIGLLFPEFSGAERWKAIGRKWLLSGIQDQFFQDGGYTQHSSNYHHLALSLAVWGSRLAELNQEPFPQGVLDLLAESTASLHAQVEPSNGMALNFGHNDGSRLLPLSSCQHGDFRPLLQVAGRAFSTGKAFSAGPWDELAIWLGYSVGAGEPAGVGIATSARSQRADLQPKNNKTSTLSKEESDFTDSKTREYPETGLVYLQGREAWAALRCACFRSRPAHSDQLNFDLWWHGVNVLQDKGSYSYNAPSPWDNPFSKAAFHNAPVIDNLDPMHRAGTFLWLDWAQARPASHRHSGTDQFELAAAEHNGYREQGICVRRTVLRIGDDLWLIVDDLFGDGRHECQWNWTLPDWDWSVAGDTLNLQAETGALRLQTPMEDAKLSLFRGGECLLEGESHRQESTQGWISPTYYALDQALCWNVRISCEFPERFCTWLSFNQADPGQLVVQYQPLKLGIPAIRSVAFFQERWIIEWG